MNRADRTELAELRDRADLAELRIETMTPADFKKLDASKLTAGEVMTLARLVDAFRTIRDFQGVELSGTEDYPSDVYASPATSERRSSPFGQYLTESRYSDEADQADEAKREALRSRIASLLGGYIDPATTVDTVGGPMAYGDIPKDENGVILSSWVDENCTCDEHERKRIERDKAAVDVDPLAFRPGNYL